MKTLKKSVITEFIKVKNTAAVWLTIAAAIFVPLMQFASYLHSEGKVRLTESENPWVSFSENSFAMSEVFILPIFVAMLVCLLMNAEHRYQMWKHLFVLPVARNYLFWARLLVAMVIMVVFFGVFFLLVIGDAWFLINH